MQLPVMQKAAQKAVNRRARRKQWLENRWRRHCSRRLGHLLKIEIDPAAWRVNEWQNTASVDISNLTFKVSFEYTLTGRSFKYEVEGNGWSEPFGRYFGKKLPLVLADHGVIDVTTPKTGL